MPTLKSDNGSQKIEGPYLNKVKQWADQYFPDGYTLVRGEGYYHGVSEDPLLINLLSDSDFPIREPLEGLKRDLSQEAILVVKSQVDLDVI